MINKPSFAETKNQSCNKNTSSESKSLQNTISTEQLNAQKQLYTNLSMFMLLSFFLLFFYTWTFFQLTTIATPLFIAGLFFLLIGLKIESANINHEIHTITRKVGTIAAASAGAITTFLLSTAFLGPVLAASLIGLTYAITTKSHKRLYKLSGPLYCGTFVGMSSSFFTSAEILLAGLLAGFVCAASREIYHKTGGTLGTIAFIATFLISVSTKYLGV